MLFAMEKTTLISAIKAWAGMEWSGSAGSPAKELKMTRKFYIKYCCCPFVICFKNTKVRGKAV
jgi:hypothetical protein